MKFILIFVWSSFLAISSHAQYPFDSKWSVDSLYQFASDSTNQLEHRYGAYNLSLWRIIYKDWNRGEVIARDYFKLAKHNNTKDRQILALHFLGFSKLMYNDLDSAFILYSESLEMAKEIEDFKLITKALNDLGNLEETRGDYNQAKQYYQESYRISIKENIILNTARSLINLGNVYEVQGEYKKSLKTFEEALEICRKHKYAGYLSAVYEHIGKIYLSIKEYKLSSKYLHLSYEQSFSPSNLNRRIKALENIALLNKEEKDYLKAIDVLNKAYDIAVELNANKHIAKVQYMKAEIYFLLNEKEEALKSIESSINVFKEGNEEELDEDFYVIAGKVYFSLNRLNEAEMYLKKAFDLGERNKSINTLKTASKNLYELYKLKGNKSESFRYLEKFVYWKEIDRNENEVKEVLKLELNQNFRKKALEDSLKKVDDIKQIKIENDHKIEKQKTNFKITYTVLIALLLILGILAFFLIKNRQNRIVLQQKNQVISNALKDNELLLKEVNHRVKNNLQIVASLLHFRIKKTDNESARNSLLDSKSRINTMMLAHQRMYQNNDYKHIDIFEYCSEIVSMLKFQCKDDSFKFQVTGEKIFVNVEQAQAVGFVLHELITNSIKYAWEESDNKEVTVGISKEKETIIIDYLENGKGIPKNVSFENSNSFGLNLINSIVKRQLMGEITFLEGKGTNIQVKFKPQDEKENIGS